MLLMSGDGFYPTQFDCFYNLQNGILRYEQALTESGGAIARIIGY